MTSEYPTKLLLSPLLHTRKPIPFFPVHSIPRSFNFYTTILGFTGRVDPSPPAAPTFASVFCGPFAAVNIYLLLNGGAGGERQWSAGRCMVGLRDLEDLQVLWEGLVERGVRVMKEGEDEFSRTGGGQSIGEETMDMGMARIGPVENKPWGYRQFDLWDPDENLIIFFAFLENDEDEQQKEDNKKK